MPTVVNSPTELWQQPQRELPIVIPVFNNPTYTKNTVDFFGARGFDEFVIINNGSQYPPMQGYLDGLPEKCIILNAPNNPGPRHFYVERTIYDWLPENFYVTDPDLGFNEELDREHILHMIDLTEENRWYKLGSALNLELDSVEHVIDIPMSAAGRITTIRGYEEGYYSSIASITRYGDLIYSAAIDTTFALYNKKFEVFPGAFMHSNFRIGGIYTATHYGWYMTPPIPEEEQDFYREAVKGAPYASTEIMKRGENYNY